MLIIGFWCGCFAGNVKQDDFRYTADTLFSLKFDGSQSCQNCLRPAEEFPFDFTFDNSNNLYLLEYLTNSIRKFDSTGKSIWERSNGDDLYDAVYNYNGKLFQTNGKKLSILDANTGASIQATVLPTSKDGLYGGDNTYFNKSVLNLRHHCSTNESFVLYDLQKLREITRKNCADYSFEETGIPNVPWPVMDCPNCSAFLGSIRPNKTHGQSTKYLALSFSEPKPESTDSFYRIVMFDKETKKMHQTDLAKYHCEPYDSRQFKFMDSNTAIVQAAEYKGGMPYMTHYIRIRFP